MTGPSHRERGAFTAQQRHSPEITRHNEKSFPVDETSMTPATPYFAGRFP
jgi:hypothetical protein